MTWCEKHRPSCYNDVKGQNEAVAKLKDFINKFSSEKAKETQKSKKSIILHGPPGTGKTALAHATAKETNSEIFELNASDLRNREKLKEVLRPAIEQRSLLKGPQGKKIILIDEVDGISKTDYGGLSELLFLIEKTSYPVIITANDIWDRKFNLLRKKSELVKLKEIDYHTIKDVLISILRKESLFIDNSILTSIAIKARGDLRAAINDLQTIVHTKDLSPISPEPKLKERSREKLGSFAFDERDKESDIFNALRMVFKNKPSKETLGIFDSVNMPLDEVLLWVEENIPTEYSGQELAKAYDFLSKADVFKGRIYKQQYWRFLVYENIFLSYGISASKRDMKTGFTTYKKPTRILKIWLNNQRQKHKKTIAEKYARCVHVGTKRAMREFPVIKHILKNPSIRQELKLNNDEIGFLDS